MHTAPFRFVFVARCLPELDEPSLFSWESYPNDYGFPAHTSQSFPARFNLTREAYLLWTTAKVNELESVSAGRQKLRCITGAYFIQNLLLLAAMFSPFNCNSFAMYSRETTAIENAHLFRPNRHSWGKKMEKQARVREFITRISSSIDLTQPLPYELLHTDSSRVTKLGSENGSIDSLRGNDFGVGLPPMAHNPY